LRSEAFGPAVALTLVERASTLAVEGAFMEHDSSSELGKSTLMLVIGAIIVIAPKFLFAKLAPFCLFPLCPLVNFSFPSSRANFKADPSASSTQFRFAPVRDAHKRLLERRGYSPRPSAFQMRQAVAQVAG
jgi:hypothetical protein